MGGRRSVSSVASTMTEFSLDTPDGWVTYLPTYLPLMKMVEVWAVGAGCVVDLVCVALLKEGNAVILPPMLGSRRV
jgi:hypothetical protein